MIAITLTQPRATLLALQAKKIETRNWATHYRGPLAIHAAAGLGPIHGKRGLLDLIEREPFWSVLRAAFAAQLGDEIHYPADAETIVDQLPFGAIVAVCELVDVRPTVRDMGTGRQGYEGCRLYHDVGNQEHAFGDYTPGRFAWLLAGIRALPKPVPAKGALGLWKIGADVLAAVQAQL